MGKVKIPKPDRPPSGDRVREGDFWPGKPAPLPGTVSFTTVYRNLDGTWPERPDVDGPVAWTEWRS